MDSSRHLDGKQALAPTGTVMTYITDGTSPTDPTTNQLATKGSDSENDCLSAPELEAIIPIDFPYRHFLIHGARHGFSLAIQGVPTVIRQQQRIYNYASAKKEADALGEFIHSETQLGRIEPTLDRLPTGRVAVLRKATGAIRQITDYSLRDRTGRLLGPNGVANTEAVPPVRLPRITDITRDIAARMVTDWWDSSVSAAVIDIAAMYRHIPIDEVSSLMTTFSVQGTTYRDCRCPMGATNSAAIAQTLMDGVLAHMRQRYPAALIYGYIDDVLLVAETRTVREICAGLQAIFASVNLPVAQHKTQGPGEQVQYIGFVLDLLPCGSNVRGYLRISRERREQLRQHIREFQTLLTKCDQRPSSRNHVLTAGEQLAGELQFVSTVARPGRAYLVALYAFVAKLRQRARETWNASFRRRVSDDLRWWDHLLQRDPARPISGLAKSDEWIISTDASTTGAAAIIWHRGIPHQAVVQPYRQRIPAKEICMAEVHAVIQAIRQFLPMLRSYPFVTCFLDNRGGLFALAQGRSRQPRLNQLVQQAWKLIVEHDLDIEFRFIPSERNYAADTLSRTRSATESWNFWYAIRTVHCIDTPPETLTILEAIQISKQHDVPGFYAPGKHGTHNGKPD